MTNEISNRGAALPRRIFRQGALAARELGEILRESVSRGGGQTAPLPPRWLRDVGPTDFEETGNEFLAHFIELGELQRTESVLEIGCGPGRMARPLTGYLQGGCYVGMDVVPRAVRWCRRNITRRHPNFTFHHADIFNQRYNPRGKLPAECYVFPFGDACFDFVFLTSVFTHMYPDDIRNYLREIARVLRPGGRLLATFFLLDSVQLHLKRQGKNQIDFAFDRGEYRLRDEAVPESAVALEEEAVHTMLVEAGLTRVGPVQRGTWSGREGGRSFQDIVVVAPRHES